MARCTAPVRGHQTASGAAACPACSSRSYRSSYDSYSYPSYSSTPYSSSGSSGGSRSSGPRSSKPRWSRASSPVYYTQTEVIALTPIRRTVENLIETKPDLRDVFLCHAWDDRQDAAKELHDLLVSNGVSVWFSEKDAGLLD